MKKTILIISILFFGMRLYAQDVDVIGKVKVFEMDYDNMATDIVIRMFDGTLGRRSLTTFQTKKYVIGDFVHGGIVFWVDETGEHGLVCAINDECTDCPWETLESTNIWARGNGPGAGMANTAIIIAAHKGASDGHFAAQVCNNAYTLDVLNRGVSYNHGDWYLPSREELNMMRLNRDKINEIAMALSAFGGKSFSENFYWSSTELDLMWAYARHFGSDSRVINIREGANHVRAVRSF